jgi:ectoine hydroxylase-related dioxygenase (phytanoyl-CoA dioxygenase family)
MTKKSLNAHKEEYDSQGFTIFRNVIDTNLLEEANEHLNFLSKKYHTLRPEHYHHPLIRDDAFWVRFVTDDRLLDIAELFLGPNIANFTAHYISKPPYDGQAVLWHQDGAYWNLTPMEALTLWCAIDPSTPENGCLKVIPGTHKLPLQKLKLRNDVPNMLYSSADYEVDTSTAIDLVLNPGDVSIHNPFIIHGSLGNKSAHRRCGLDMGFIKTSTQISSKDLYLYPLLVRGEAIPGINTYRPWPEFNLENTIPFQGWNEWDEKIKLKNQGYETEGEDPSDVLTVTHHMIDRLKEGTTSHS